MNTTFIQVEISAEEVMTAMNDDPGFALSMWESMAEHLHMGLMTDNLCDLVSTADRKERFKAIFNQFRASFDLAEDLHMSDCEGGAT